MFSGGLLYKEMRKICSQKNEGKIKSKTEIGHIIEMTACGKDDSFK